MSDEEGIPAFMREDVKDDDSRIIPTPDMSRTATLRLNLRSNVKGVSDRSIHSKKESRSPTTREDGTDAIEETFGGEFSWEEVGMDQINALRSENEQLVVAVDTQRRQIDDLKDIILASEPIAGLDPKSLLNVVMPDGSVVDQDFRDVKLMQMAKKVRMLRVKLNRSRAQVAELLPMVEKLKLQAKKADVKKTERSEGKREAEQKKDVDALAETRLKLKRLTSCMTRLQLRVQNEQDLRRKYHKVLLRELGDQKTVAKALDEKESGPSSSPQGGWRGRAQTIALLKTKTKKLEAELRITRASASGCGEFSSNKDTKDVDLRAARDIRKMETLRRRKVQSMEKSLEEAQSKLSELHREHNGAKARIRVLEKEGREAKASVEVMLAKDANSNEFIEELERAHRESERRNGELSREVERLRVAESAADENVHLRKMNQKLQIKFETEHQRAVTETRELRSRIRDLTNEIASLKARQRNGNVSSTTASTESQDTKIDTEADVDAATLRALVDRLREKLDAQFKRAEDAESRCLKQRQEHARDLASAAAEARSDGGANKTIEALRRSLSEADAQIKTVKASCRKMVMEKNDEIRRLRRIVQGS